MLNVSKIYFSPSGTTKKVIEEIASNFEGKINEYDLLNFNSAKEFSENDLVIVGLPIFAGRLPKTASDRLKKFKGNKTPAIAIANYGNAHISDALLELKDIMDENNFKLLGIGTTVSQHSIFTDTAVGRPDSDDLKKINEFASECKTKLENNEFKEIDVPGQKPYCEVRQLPFIVACDDSLCAFCYDCVSICPENAIPDDDPIGTDLDNCSRCTACIHICPENARMFSGQAYEKKKEVFSKVNGERKEAEFYL